MPQSGVMIPNLPFETRRCRVDAPGALGDRIFDLVVVGGGILGACVARDAATRGLSVALLERGDFAGGTSSNSLKVIHGGLRHLQHFDLAEFRRSVLERRHWLRTAPHLVEPLPVLVPFGRRSEGLLLRAGLALNDLLSRDRNRGVLAERQLPGRRFLGAEEARECLGPMAPPDLLGAALYHDALMYSSERLVLEVLLAAREAGALTLNHVEVLGPRVVGGVRTGVRVRDLVSGTDIAVRSRGIVIAAGPWGQRVEATILDRPISTDGAEALSLAWNLVLPDRGLTTALAVPGRAPTPTGKGGTRPRRLFLLPWRGCTLVGTGHAPFRGDPASFTGLEPDHPQILAFMDEVNAALPQAPFSRDAILRIHAGLLPATTSGAGTGVRLRRTPEFRVTRGGGIPVLAASTVKFTASRHVAEVTVNRMARLLARKIPPSVTTDLPLPGSPPDGMVPLLEAAKRELSGTLSMAQIRHLVRTHGTRWLDVLDSGRRDPEATSTLDPHSDDLRAQLHHGLTQEFALTPEDLLLRRAELGARGPLTEAHRRLALDILDAP